MLLVGCNGVTGADTVGRALDGGVRGSSAALADFWGVCRECGGDWEGAGAGCVVLGALSEDVSMGTAAVATAVTVLCTCVGGGDTGVGSALLASDLTACANLRGKEGACLPGASEHTHTHTHTDRDRCMSAQTF